MSVEQQLLEKGAAALQSLKPMKQMSQHVCTFALYGHDLTRQIETHHYVTRINHYQDFLHTTPMTPTVVSSVFPSFFEGRDTGAGVDQPVGRLLEAAWQGLRPSKVGFGIAKMEREKRVASRSLTHRVQGTRVGEQAFCKELKRHRFKFYYKRKRSGKGQRVRGQEEERRKVLSKGEIGRDREGGGGEAGIQGRRGGGGWIADEVEGGWVIVDL
ncbi:histone acetyltransferase [Actinidia rufa]|uniref:Histone acetyltransferase n=1 Tax=Actinidia rufa TaxID=165716 RepID=A0A7J0G5V8_9ERIC|nr:histone acetyltransferase [Actinidia rufa]